MSEALLSVGLDVGTTSTQLVVSRLTVENQASSFAVPDMTISDREILYESPVYFTPLISENRVDGDQIREIVLHEYQKAGITREQVDTGAVIITGETSRKENAGAVLAALSDYAGDFVVATAGPHLESVLAAKGAGALTYSQDTGKRVLHMDIGGGTSNLAWVEDGEIVKTGCLNVGGRLIKFDKQGTIFYLSPVLEKLCKLNLGETVTKPQLEQIAEKLVQALEMAAGLRPLGELMQLLSTAEAGAPVWTESGEPWVISFSGGVADCIDKAMDWTAFGDMGPVLGQAIRQSRLCQEDYRLGTQTIRATVIGAGCHSAQLSGSTVYHANVPFPMKNRPVVCLTQQEQEKPGLAESIRAKMETLDTPGILALPGFSAPNYEKIRILAREIVQGMGKYPVFVALEQDMAKALGQAMALLLPKEAQVLCMDKVKLSPDSYLDVGAPVGPVLPVVVKTLVLER